MDMHHSHLRPDGTTWPPVTPDPPPPPGYVNPLDALDDSLAAKAPPDDDPSGDRDDRGSTPGR